MLANIPFDLSKIREEDIDKELMRAAIIAELDAINLYEQMANLTKNEDLKVILLDVAKEEKTHVGEFQALLLRLDKQQVEEMITRDKNHPSVIMWSVACEPDSDVPQAVPFLKALADLSHSLDRTRPVTFVSHIGVNDDAIHHFDVMSLNRYYGWYTQPAQLDVACQMLSDEIDAMYEKFGKPFLLTECGADTIPGLHADPPELFSEEFQVEMIRRYLEVVRSKPYAIGTHIWNFADFKTAQAFRRVGGVNYKGVFTRERQPKMVAHALRRLWRQGEAHGGE